MDIQNAVYSDSLYFLPSHVALVGRHSLQEIHVAAGHPAGMGVVGDGSEHGENKMAVHLELLLFVHAPVIDHGGTEPRHLDVVSVGQGAPGGFPTDRVTAVHAPPVIFCLKRENTQEREDEENLFHDIYFIAIFLLPMMFRPCWGLLRR